jgi:hypothetical protein
MSIRSRTYSTWCSMRQRCNNPNNPKWKHYGGRGIRVSERWNSFANFLADMGEKPPGTSIDRIDNDKGYEPGNCRWADALTQANNTRLTRPNGGVLAHKTATITMRMYPHVKEIAEMAAKEDQRSLANLIEHLLVAHCNRNRDLEARP